MRVTITEEALAVHLSWWEKFLGLLKDIHVARADISEVRVVADPMREAMRAGMKAGLRLPYLIIIARTLRLDEAFVVRRGVAGLSFAVENHGALKRVLLSTPRAEELARELGGG